MELGAAQLWWRNEFASAAAEVNRNDVSASCRGSDACLHGWIHQASCVTAAWCCLFRARRLKGTLKASLPLAKSFVTMACTNIFFSNFPAVRVAVCFVWPLHHSVPPSMCNPLAWNKVEDQMRLQSFGMSSPCCEDFLSRWRNDVALQRGNALMDAVLYLPSREVVTSPFTNFFHGRLVKATQKMQQQATQAGELTGQTSTIAERLEICKVFAQQSYQLVPINNWQVTLRAYPFPWELWIEDLQLGVEGIWTETQLRADCGDRGIRGEHRAVCRWSLKFAKFAKCSFHLCLSLFLLSFINVETSTMPYAMCICPRVFSLATFHCSHFVCQIAASYAASCCQLQERVGIRAFQKVRKLLQDNQPRLEPDEPSFALSIS